MAATYTTGTIVPAVNFDQEKAATIFHKAMKGLGTDEKAIIDMLTMHSNSQLQRILQQYKTAYGKDCIEDLKSELSGCFEKAVVNRLCPLRELHACYLKKAMHGTGTDEEGLIDILCTANNNQIQEMKNAYHDVFRGNLEDDLASECSGHLKRIFISQAQANRDESAEVKMDVVDRDAKELFEAGEGQLGTDESVFNRILATRSFQHLRAVFEKYKSLSSKTVEEAVRSEMSGDARDAYLAIVKFAMNPIAYHTERFHKAMHGAGTDDDALIRLLVSHCEIDLVEIKAEFKAKYGKSLEDWVKGDTSGDYGKLLLRFVQGYEGENA